MRVCYSTYVQYAWMKNQIKNLPSIIWSELCSFSVIDPRTLYRRYRRCPLVYRSTLRTSKRSAPITAPTRRNNNDRQKRIIIVLDARRRYTTDRYHTHGSCDRTRRYNVLKNNNIRTRFVRWIKFPAPPHPPDRVPDDDTAAQLQQRHCFFFLLVLYS